MIQHAAMHEKKSSLSLKRGSVNGGDCTRQAQMSKYISEKTFLTDVHSQLNNYSKKLKTESYLAKFNSTLKYTKFLERN